MRWECSTEKINSTKGTCVGLRKMNRVIAYWFRKRNPTPKAITPHPQRLVVSFHIKFPMAPIFNAFLIIMLNVYRRHQAWTLSLWMGLFKNPVCGASLDIYHHPWRSPGTNYYKQTVQHLSFSARIVCILKSIMLSPILEEAHRTSAFFVFWSFHHKGSRGPSAIW